MNNKIARWGLSATLLLAWAFPLFGVTYNQLYPGFESALGVAYGFLLGCVIHLVLLLAWIAIRRRRLEKAELRALLISFCVMLALMALSDGGWLSKTSP